MHIKKLAIITTHPIQYNAPMFRLLSERGRVKLKVFYTLGEKYYDHFDSGFGKVIKWDIPLLEGYDYVFLKNSSIVPNANHFFSIINPCLNKEVKSWNADALLVFGWHFYSHLSAIMHFKNKIPIFFRGDSHLLGRKNKLSNFLRSQLTWIYKNIDIALYVGQNNKNYFLNYGLKEKQLFFVPHAIDNKRFQLNIEENKIQSLAWRRLLGIADDEIVFLYVGKLISAKGILFLIETFKQLKLTNAHLILAGSGVCERKCKENINSRIHFIGFQNQKNMPVVYNLGDVLVVPSINQESWALVVNEAMVCGLPVLVSNKCGCAIDLVHQGVNGYIFASGDTNGLRLKMEAMSDNERLKIMGKASLEIINNWSLELSCSRIEEIISSY